MYNTMVTLEGKNKPRLPEGTTADDVVRAQYINAAKKHCYLCGEKPLYTIGKFPVPEELQPSVGPDVLFGLCEVCYIWAGSHKIMLANCLLTDLEDMEKARRSAPRAASGDII